MLEHFADVHHHARRHGQCVAHVVEQLFELRHNEAQHGDQRKHGHAQQNRRVDRRRNHAFAQRADALHVLDQTRHDGRHLAGNLARADHVHVEIAEQLRVIGQRLAERRTALDLVQNVDQQRGDRGLVAHVDEHAQRVVQRQPGLQHDRQFGGQRQHILRIDLGLGIALFPGRILHASRHCTALVRARTGFLHVQRRHALVAQTLEHLSGARGIHAALGDLAVGGGGAPVEIRHRSGPVSRVPVHRGWSHRPAPCADRLRAG